jgi:septum formation protein
MKLILASTSAYRKSLLERLCYRFTCEKPQVDEEVLKKKILDPQKLSSELAILKAQDVLNRYPDAIVIGGDQVAAIDGEILSKPHTFERALSQLTKMQGRTHELFTAVHISSAQKSISLMEVTKLKMRTLSSQEIESYLRLDNPLDCAGSYKIESRGIKLFEEINGEDFDAIVGLPLMKLQNALLSFDFNLFD